MVVQYPYTLEVLKHIGGTYDPAGNPIPSQEVWQQLAKCRDEAGNGKKVSLSDNTVNEYAFLVQLPKGTEAVPVDTIIRVMDGQTVRCTGKVIYSRKDQLHSRLWV